MKKIIYFCSFFLLLQSFQCDDENPSDIITEEMLLNKKQEIDFYISEFSCEEASGCNYIAFGAKPCGGPRSYLVYPNNVDQNIFEQLVSEYYSMDSLRNIQTNAVSDCAMVMPPIEIDCVNGNCIIIN